MKAEEAGRLKELEAQNHRLRKLVAEVELDKAIFREALKEFGVVVPRRGTAGDSDQPQRTT